MSAIVLGSFLQGKTVLFVRGLKSTLGHAVVCTPHSVNVAASRFVSSTPSSSEFSLNLFCVAYSPVSCLAYLKAVLNKRFNFFLNLIFRSKILL